MYDLIGDIHGHAGELKALLSQLGYQPNRSGVYAHPEHRVIFLGDFIDRGPQIRETLQIARGMIDAGSALAVMGNHEYNAICFHTKDPDGQPLRPHTDKNIQQHSATLDAFRDDPEELHEYLQWMKQLPLWLELDEFRVIHACWHPELIGRAQDQVRGNRLTEAFLHKSAQKDSEAYEILEILLKGIEMQLPPGETFRDKDNHLRTEMRVRWWKSPRGLTYADYGIGGNFSTNLLPESFHDNFHYPPEGEKPVFIGHYWLRGEPALQSPSVCCLDYSVAKGGELVGYRWNGERMLREGNFVRVKSFQ